MIVHAFILLLFASVVPIHGLLCYECGCAQTNLTACNCGLTSNSTENDHCVIFEQRDITGTFIELSRIPRDSSAVFVEDTYYILMQESIRYNLTTRDWYLWTNSIRFGCDWDLCNSPNLIDSLPDSFKLSIGKNWLDTNIYGTGSVDGCHFCPRGVCGDAENPIDFSQCPMTPCANATTCLAFDLWNDLDTGEQCYYSECAPGYLDGEFSEYYGGKYRVDIEAIVYLAQDRSNYDIWEIDVYCGVNNCTRSTIFEEVTQQLSANISNLSAFPSGRPSTTQSPTTQPTTTQPPTTTAIANPLTCYTCSCFDTTTCPCAATVVVSLDYNYCVIVRENFGQTVYIYSDYLNLYSTDMFINDFPYALIEESITYDENGGLWYTTTNFVVYGCNWNLCNKDALIPLLPNSYQMRLPEAWLNSNVLGTGLPVRDCHECPGAAVCGTTDFLDANACPIQPCNTTCLVVDSYDDPDSDLLCYHSSCLPPDTVNNQMERHRIDIEGIVYASQPSVVELWEVDIYCRADNCSRPGIFKEFHEQLTVQVGTLAALFNETHDPTIPQRRCYDCYCYNTLNCSCERTTIVPANSTYCLLFREYIGQEAWTTLGHIDQQSSRVHIEDFPYLIVEESILYSEQTGLWNTRTNFAMYGCDWDYCNDPNLIPYLPTSFQMRLPEVWLNSSILGTGQPARNCHECPATAVCGTTESIDDVNLCPVAQCNTTCVVFDIFDDPKNDLQCYQSFCGASNPEFDLNYRHRVEIEGILYLQKQPRAVELWEIDVYCGADDCSRLGIFTEIRSQIQVDYGDLSAFDRLNPTLPSIATSNIMNFNSLNVFITLLLLALPFNFY